MKPEPDCQARHVYEAYKHASAFNMAHAYERKHVNQHATVYVMDDGSRFIVGRPHNFYKAYRDQRGVMGAVHA